MNTKLGFLPNVHEEAKIVRIRVSANFIGINVGKSIVERGWTLGYTIWGLERLHNLKSHKGNYCSQRRVFIVHCIWETNTIQIVNEKL